MGYIHDTHFSQFIPIEAATYTAGTWTPTLANNILANVRTAADASFTIYIPIPVPSNDNALKGAKLKSIDVYYNMETAAADDFATVELEKMTLPPDASGSAVAVSGAAVTTTEDSGHDSAAERKATGMHTMKVSITTPLYIDDKEAYYLTLTVDAAATTDFTYYGAVANFELRT